MDDIIDINSQTLTANYTNASTAFVLPNPNVDLLRQGNVAWLRIVTDGTHNAVVKTGGAGVVIAPPVSGEIQNQTVLAARSERFVRYTASDTHIAVMASGGGSGTLSIQVVERKK